MKILLLSPNQIGRYNWGHQLFRNEIGKQTPVTYYGDGFPNFNCDLNVKQIVEMYCPDVDLIMTYGWRYSKNFEGLGDINIPKVHITVDYVPTANIPVQNKFFKKNKYDLVFGITVSSYKRLVENKVCSSVHILPFSADCNIYKPLNLSKKNQILAAFTTRTDIYPNRRKIQKVATATGFPVITKRTIQQKLIRAINTSKITATSNNIFHSLSMRYTETLACGGFLLADKPDDLDFVGLEDGKHLVLYYDMKDFSEKVKYYMLHDTERKKIEKAGMNFVRNNHSCEIRVKEMMGFIKEKIGVS